MIPYAIVRIKLSSKYLPFEEWIDKYGEELDIYWQESGCHLDKDSDFERWAKGFFHDCQRWDEYEKDD